MICKAIKWLVLSGTVLGGAGFLLFGTNLGSYVGTMAASVKEGIEGQIPVEFEIRRAEKLIQQIDPQVENCKRDVARTEVELDDLKASVTQLEKVCDSEEKKLKTGARMLSGDGNAEYRLASDHLGRRRVETDLQHTMDSFRNNQAILKTKRTLIDRQSESVNVAKQRLQAVRAEKENLEDQVRALKTQQQWIQTMAASSKRFDLDDSALSQAKEALKKVQNRLAIAQKMLEADVVILPEDAVASEPSRDVLKEIAEQFGAPGQPAVVVDYSPKR